MKKFLCIAGVVLIAFFAIGASKKNTRIIMVGDSTMAAVADNSACGWGQEFSSFLDSTVTVDNFAQPGLTAKIILANGYWNEIVQKIQKGDIVLIQFGYSDFTSNTDQRYATIEEFEQNLMQMVSDVKKAKGQVILCTPCSRRYFNQEGIAVRRHGGYPNAVRGIAKKEGVTLIDLEEDSYKWLSNIGKEASAEYYEEGENARFTVLGAKEMAHMAAQSLFAQNHKTLAKHIVF